MAQNITASILYGAKDLRIETREIQPPGPDEVQISIRATGLCGSDVHYYQQYRNGDIKVQEPLTLGHEAAGVICALGSDVYDLQVGEAVAIEPGLPCGECIRCKEGRYNICPDLSFRGSAKSIPHLQGTLQQKINHPAAWCHRLPRSVHLIMGALLEPLSVAIHAFRRAGLNSKSRPKVLIFGSGTIGLCCAAVCKCNGATATVIVDKQGERANFARLNGFASDALTIPADDGGNGAPAASDLERAKEIAQMVLDVSERTKGGYDVIFECTGANVCTQAAIYACRPGGRVVVAGMGSPNQTLPLSAAILREVDIVGTFRYANTYPVALELISKARTSMPGLHTLISHSFNGFDAIVPAFETASKSHDEHGKVVLKTILTFDG